MGRLSIPPAPRPLDLFRVKIEDGQVKVDTGDKIRRDHPNDSQIIYA